MYVPVDDFLGAANSAHGFPFLGGHDEFSTYSPSPIGVFVMLFLYSRGLILPFRSATSLSELEAEHPRGGGGVVLQQCPDSATAFAIGLCIGLVSAIMVPRGLASSQGY